MLPIRVCASLLLAGCLASTAYAQAASTGRASSSSPSDEATFGIGYSFLHIPKNVGNAGIGVDAQYAAPFQKLSGGSLGYFADFSWNHSTAGDEGVAGNVELVTGGVRASFDAGPRGEVYVLAGLGFGHIGVDEEGGSSGLDVDFGGGVRLPLGRRLGVFTQVDFPVTHWSTHGDGDTFVNFRLNAGIAVRLGR